jgi:arylsulfatase A-like enzyme
MAGWGAGGRKPRFRHAPRNVILLVLESTAARYLSVYGSRYGTTPRLQAESRHSLVFDNFYCHFGLTSHSLVALTLSIYPGMTWREYTVERPDLPGTTVAEILQPRGYRSAFIHSGDLAYSNQVGFLSNRGFEDLWDFRDLGCGPASFSWGVEDRCLIDGMLKWIDQDRERPFYLMGWTIQTHHPYPLSEGQPALDLLQGEQPPDAYDLSRYLNVLHEVDRQIGRLLAGLRSRGLADDTLVIITGDHGEAFGDPHDTYGHGRKLYQENVNVPLVLWNPKLFAGGPHRKTLGGHIDLSPTVLDLLGLPPAPSWQGRSLFAETRPPRVYFYAADHDYLLGVRENDWKYVYDVRHGREFLFDLGRDPLEQVNRAAEDPARCRRLRQRVTAWMDYQERYLAAIEVARR